MSKRQKLISWTPANDARLMLTILAVENVHPNCEAVAKAFGGAVNAMAISNRLSRLRKKAADEGFVPKTGAATSAKDGKGNGGGKKAGVRKESVMAAEGSEAESNLSVHEDSDNPPTRKDPIKNQKVLTGRVTKARNPAKKNAKDSTKYSDDVDTETANDDLDGAEESVFKAETYDEDDSAGLIKVE